jgi:hypothetical protein
LWWERAEDVVDRPPVVHAGRYSAVAVVAGFAAWPLESLDLVALRMMHECEVRIAVAPDGVMLEASVVQTGGDPVLETPCQTG